MLLLVLLCLVLPGTEGQAPAPTNPAYGTTFNGFPVWEERATLTLLNAVRQAPTAWVNTWMGLTGTRSSPFMQLPRQRPLFWSYDLNRSSRSHSFQLIETCPNNPPPPHFSCGGTESFDQRILRFYSPAFVGMSENQVSFPDSSNQYFHTPKHAMRAFLCDGPFGWTGTGNSAWPQGNCPADSSAGHRQNIMSSSARNVGIGIWGKSGVLVNAKPSVHVQDFAFNTDNFYPNVRVYSGSHIFMGDGTGDNMQSMQFVASYFDAAGGTTAPQKIQVWLMGTVIPLTCDTAGGWGVSVNDCVYRSATIPTTANCRLYFFDVIDASGTARRYPESGAYWTYGEGACRSDWVPASTSDPIIAANGQGATPPPTTLSTVAGTTANTQPATSSSTAVTTQPGFLNSGCLVRVKYNADFQIYVTNGQMNAGPVQTLQGSTATVMNIPSTRLLAKQVSFGSTVVDWFVYDVNTAGSAANAVDSFLARFATGTDVPIGQHQPPIMTASMLDRATTAGASAPAAGGGRGGPSVAMIAGIGAGVSILLVAAVVVVVVIFLKRRGSASGYSRTSSYVPLLKNRFEPVVSQHYENDTQHRDSVGSPRGEGVESPRAIGGEYHGSMQSHDGGGAGGLRRRSGAAERCRVLYDFASELPDTLPVRAGDVVTVVNKGNSEWYDVQNASGVVGFVPASYLAAHRGGPSAGAAYAASLPDANQRKPFPKPPGAVKPLPMPRVTEKRELPILPQAEYFAGEEFPHDQEVSADTPVAVDFDVEEDEAHAVATPPVAAAQVSTRVYVPTVKVKRQLPPGPNQTHAIQKQPVKQQLVKVKVKKAAVTPPSSQQQPVIVPRLAAPVPGKAMKALYAHTPLTEREVALRVGDLLVIPAGMENLGGDEWVYVFNRNTSQKGYVPRAFIG